jgi:hypothetical protein
MSTSDTKPQATLEGMPSEVMAMIVRAISGNDGSILSLEDLLNPRLTSRRIEDMASYAIRQRHLDTRRYILSPASLKTVANDPRMVNVDPYILQLVIGPERINSNSRSLLEHMAEGKVTKWEKKFLPVWRSLVEEQAQFEANSEDISSLAEIFKRLVNLQSVHMDTIPRDEKAWRSACGAESVLNKVGDKEFNDQYTVGGWLGAESVLLDERNVYRHYDRVLVALTAIADRPHWTLDISLNVIHMWLHAAPIDLSSYSWSMACKRVRRVTLERKDMSGFQSLPSLWVQQLLHDCSNLQTLTLGCNANYEHVLLQSTFGNLRHLTISYNRVCNAELTRFLEVHAKTLESITLDNVVLSSQFKAQDLWFKMFKLMGAMPNLNSVHFSCLTAEFNGNPRALKCVDEDDAPQVLQAKSSVTACKDAIIPILDRTIEKEIITVEDIWGTAIRVWFPIQYGR